MRAQVEEMLLAQREGMFCWVPVCLAIGIGIYFALPEEPGLPLICTLACAAVILVFLSRIVGQAYAPLLIAIMLVIVGLGAAKTRVTMVDAPILTFRYYGPIQGRVVNIDRSSNDARRLTLDQVVLARMSPAKTPARVRVSLYGDQPISAFAAGDVVILTGHLSPPAGPAEPGGFDFQRHAWFLQLGAVGYTRTPVLRWAPPDQAAFSVRIFDLRRSISVAVQDAMPGETGAFAAAIMTGDRSGMQQDILVDLRASNLAHLLAISGLHMGLLTGFVFAVIRYGLALVPILALRLPTKKIAAVCALCVGAFYLALSGGNVATERAFIMVAVMLVAVLLGRRALTLRAVAMAAIIVLVWQPEALIGPGFQMSFAATTALVVVFGSLRGLELYRLPSWTRPVLSVVLSSLVAGLATAPFAAAHFNQIAHYGLIANVLSVPVMGLLVMPAAVLAVCLAPFGLWEIGLAVMELGLRWIIWVAQSVAAQEGALSHVWAPDWRVLPLLSLGLLALILLKGHLRFAGLATALCAAFLWQMTERPTLLVADSGGLIGVQTEDGRALSKPRGSGFVAGIWLENDGWPVAQDIAAARTGFTKGMRSAAVDLGDWRILQVSGKTSLAALSDCDGADILITNQVDETARSCTVYDLTRLRATGALAMDITSSGDLLVTSAHHVAGHRPWNAHQGRSDQNLHLSLSQKERVATATLLPVHTDDQ